MNKTAETFDTRHESLPPLDSPVAVIRALDASTRHTWLGIGANDARGVLVLDAALVRDRRALDVAIDDLEGRVTTSLVTPYPPGIPLLVPGEVFNAKIVDYLRFNREFAQECPGFETDIHGLVQTTTKSGEVQYFADCVAI